MTSENDERPDPAAAAPEDSLNGLDATRAMPFNLPPRTANPIDLDATRPLRSADYQPLDPHSGTLNGHSSNTTQTYVSNEPAETTTEFVPFPAPGNVGATEPTGSAQATEQSEEMTEPPPVAGDSHRSGWPIVREIVETIVLAAVIFLGVRAVVQNFRVEGSSMFASFLDGEYMLVNKVEYTRIDLTVVHKVLPFVHPGSNPERYIFHGPQRGDVIVFVPPPQAGQPGKDFIKRVIGLPGDTVDFRNAHVFVNGRQVLEPYITEPTQCQGGQYCHVQLQNNQYFVMGDNRTNSSDSRFWGPVSGDKIIGKALLSYFCDGSQCKNHFDHVGLSPNHSTQLAPAVKPAS